MATKKKVLKKKVVKPAVNKAVAKKVLKKATKGAAKKPAAGKAPARKAGAKKPVVKKPAKKAVAKKTAKKVSATRAAKKVSKPKRVKAAPAKMISGERAKKKSAQKKAAARASVKGATVGVGSKAPAFELLDQSGALVSSKGLAGQKYVVYFYPKDNTPGCTKEACEFRDNGSQFEASKVKVFGVSADSAKSHAGFADKYSLPFTLLSDPDKKLISAYGCWVEKQNYGRTYMGIQRSTFVVDEGGKIVKAWRGVKVPGHVERVLSEVR